MTVSPPRTASVLTWPVTGSATEHSTTPSRTKIRAAQRSMISIHPLVPRMPTARVEVRMFMDSSFSRGSATSKRRLPSKRRTSRCFPSFRTSTSLSASSLMSLESSRLTQA